MNMDLESELALLRAEHSDCVSQLNECKKELHLKAKDLECKTESLKLIRELVEIQTEKIKALEANPRLVEWIPLANR